MTRMGIIDHGHNETDSGRPARLGNTSLLGDREIENTLGRSLRWRQSLHLCHATCQLLYTVPGIAPRLRAIAKPLLTDYPPTPDVIPSRQQHPLNFSTILVRIPAVFLFPSPYVIRNAIVEARCNSLRRKNIRQHFFQRQAKTVTL